MYLYCLPQNSATINSVTPGVTYTDYTYGPNRQLITVVDYPCSTSAGSSGAGYSWGTSNTFTSLCLDPNGGNANLYTAMSGYLTILVSTYCSSPTLALKANTGGSSYTGSASLNTGTGAITYPLTSLISNH